MWNITQISHTYHYSHGVHIFSMHTFSTLHSSYVLMCITVVNNSPVARLQCWRYQRVKHSSSSYFVKNSLWDLCNECLIYMLPTKIHLTFSIRALNTKMHCQPVSSYGDERPWHDASPHPPALKWIGFMKCVQSKQ